LTPALVRSRRRSRPSGYRRRRRTEGLRPSEPPPKGANSPLLKPPFCRPSHVTVFLGLSYLKILTPKNAGFFGLRTQSRKGSMEQSVHRPLSQSGLPIVRRVNSAIGERVGLDLLRRPRRPVVTDSSIDPSTHPHPELLPWPCASGSCRDSSAQGFRCIQQ
jgi:hypothetical protein